MLWIPRPQPAADKTRAALAAVGLPCHVAPLHIIQHRTVEKAVLEQEAPPLTGLLCSSLAALNSLQPWRDLPLYCVGASVAAQAQSLGFTTVQTAPTMAALLPHLPTAPEDCLLYAHGAQLRMSLADLRAQIQCQLYPVCVYSLQQIDHWPALPAGITGVAVFSEQCCDALAALMPSPTSLQDWTAFCLSPHLAERAARLPFASVQACAKPTHDHWIALIQSAYDRPEKA